MKFYKPFFRAINSNMLPSVRLIVQQGPQTFF